MSIATEPTEPTPPDAGAEAKSLEQRIAEQGVAESATYEKLFGRAAELWDDDDEFAAFLEGIHNIRREQG